MWLEDQLLFLVIDGRGKSKFEGGLNRKGSIWIGLYSDAGSVLKFKFRRGPSKHTGGEGMKE